MKYFEGEEGTFAVSVLDTNLCGNPTFAPQSLVDSEGLSLNIIYYDINLNFIITNFVLFVIKPCVIGIQIFVACHWN